MSRIYISYRSIDSHQKAIQQIYAHLAQTYGVDYVTLSSQDQSLDTTLRQAQVQSHNVLLVIFGRYGLNMVDERGNRLIADPYDAQHIEISAGLKHRLQVHTLVFDDMVENLSDHIPEVLNGLTSEAVILGVTNATVSETVENLVKTIGTAKPRVSASKPDISKMVIQPSSKQATTTHVNPQLHPAQPTPEPEIYIHQSRNPVIRFFQRIGQHIIGSHHPQTTQIEENNRPDAGRPRVESYRQMWPTSFLIIATVIAFGIFVAFMVQVQAPSIGHADFDLREVATMGQGAVDVAFSADGSQVAQITSYGEVNYFALGTTDTPDSLSVRMSSPREIDYGMDDLLVMRNDSRIFVINTHEYGGYLAHQYVADRDAKILDMAVSRTSPVIAFVLDTGEVVRWDYGTSDILEKSFEFEFLSPPQIILSDDHHLIAVHYDKSIWVGTMDTMRDISQKSAISLFLAFDNDDMSLINFKHEKSVSFYDIFDWSRQWFKMQGPDFTVSTIYRDFIYHEDTNHLIQRYDNEIRIWEIGRSGRYLGAYEAFEDYNDMNAIIQSIALSADGQYLAATTITDTVIWELDIAD